MKTQRARSSSSEPFLLSLFTHPLSLRCPLSLSSISPSSDLRSEFRRRHCTPGIAVAEVAVGAAGGWGSYEIVRFRRCPHLSRHY
ncbi:hypothetical protein PIB30_105337, partial [Stylosanthes scabra]|nr:hypothetical protein [Stylosanthes scabra]